MRFITAFFLITTLFVGRPAGAALLLPLPDPDTTPADGQGYARERFFEEARLWITFGEARTELLLRNADERLAEVRKLAEEGNNEALVPRGVLLRAARDYEKGVMRAARRAGAGFKTAAELRRRVADSLAHHLEVLDELRDSLPEAARGGITRARGAAAGGVETAIRALAKKDPENAARAYADALMERLLRARERAEAGYSDAAMEATEEFKRLEPLGDDIAALARKHKADRAVADIFAEVRLSHVRRLEEIMRSAPEAARPGIQQALDRARALEERLPAQFRNSPFAPNVAQ
jgi:hypothetical protein